MNLTIKSLSINDIIKYSETNKLTYPGFQRGFVWKEKARTMLIDSILKGIPVPMILVYEKDENVFDVLDGQQRIKSIINIFGKNKNFENNKEYFIDFYKLLLYKQEQISKSLNIDIVDFYTKKGKKIKDEISEEEDTFTIFRKFIIQLKTRNIPLSIFQEYLSDNDSFGLYTSTNFDFFNFIKKGFFLKNDKGDIIKLTEHQINVIFEHTIKFVFENLNNFRLNKCIIQNQTNPHIYIDIFEKINKGGTPLNFIDILRSTLFKKQEEITEYGNLIDEIADEFSKNFKIKKGKKDKHFLKIILKALYLYNLFQKNKYEYFSEYNLLKLNKEVWNRLWNKHKENIFIFFKNTSEGIYNRIFNVNEFIESLALFLYYADFLEKTKKIEYKTDYLDIILNMLAKNKLLTKLKKHLYYSEKKKLISIENLRNINDIMSFKTFTEKNISRFKEEDIKEIMNKKSKQINNIILYLIMENTQKDMGYSKGKFNGDVHHIIPKNNRYVKEFKELNHRIDGIENLTLLNKHTNLKYSNNDFPLYFEEHYKEYGEETKNEILRNNFIPLEEYILLVNEFKKNNKNKEKIKNLYLSFLDKRKKLIADELSKTLKVK